MRGTRRGWVVVALSAAAMAAHAADDELSDRAHREQIDAERAAAQARYEQAIAECERRFVVTSCVDQAKAERRATLDRLSREQMVLDDAQRKRRAEERREQIAAKKARQAQQAQQAQEAATREAASSPTLPRKPRPSTAPASGTKPARRIEPRSSEAAAAAAAEAAERAADSQQRRERAQAHAEAVRRRNAERAAERVPAAPLPVPGTSAAGTPAVPSPAQVPKAAPAASSVR
jgi:colicin import membrane protein